LFKFFKKDKLMDLKNHRKEAMPANHLQAMRDVTPELTGLAEAGTILSQYYVQQVTFLMIIED
jgi:hypothetical protein